MDSCAVVHTSLALSKCLVTRSPNDESLFNLWRPSKIGYKILAISVHILPIEMVIEQTNTMFISM